MQTEKRIFKKRSRDSDNKYSPFWGPSDKRYFSEKFEVGGRKFVKCNLGCGDTTSQVSYNRTNNLKKHLAHYHPDILSNLQSPITPMPLIDKREIDLCYTLMLIKENKAFSLLSGEHARDFTTKLNNSWVPPCWETIDKIIDHLYDISVSKVNLMLKDLSLFPQTADCWKSKAGDDYLVVNIHKIEQFQRKKITIGVIHLTEIHNGGKRIAREYNKIYKQFEIKSDKVVETTDGGSNMETAADLLEHPWTHCGNHRLNLTVKECLKEVSGLINKASRVVSTFKQSGPCSKILKRCQKTRCQKGPHLKLIQENDTRWNSTFLMLERLHVIRSEVKEAFEEIKKDGKINIKTSPPTDLEWAQIFYVIQFLKEFKRASDVFEGENSYLHSNIIIIRLLKTYCEKFKTTHQKKTDWDVSLTSMVEIALENLSQRWSQTPLVFNLPIFFAPHFKTKYLEKKLAKEVNETVKQEFLDLQNLSGPLKPPVQVDLGILSQFNTLPKDLELEEFNNYLQDVIPSSATPLLEDPLIYWKSNQTKYPLLSQLACKYLAIRASQSDVERDNSFLKKMITDQRTKLQPEKVSKMLFIKNNY